MASNSLPQPRATHLTDPVTSRDLYGTVRGACSCNACGRYIIYTEQRYTSTHQENSKGAVKHPDNDPSITFCSRCGCPPDAHAPVRWETERELGTDAYALHQWDTAILHYTRAIESHSVEASLWTNRAAAYLAKGWPAQALHDAEHAAALRPDWHRPWARKGAALLELKRWQEAEKAYETALGLAREQGDTHAIPGLEMNIRDAQARLKSSTKARPPASLNNDKLVTRTVISTAASHSKAAVQTTVQAMDAAGPSSADCDNKARTNGDVEIEAKFLSQVDHGPASSDAEQQQESKVPAKVLYGTLKLRFLRVEQELAEIRSLMAQLQKKIDAQPLLGEETSIDDDSGQPVLAEDKTKRRHKPEQDTRSSGDVDVLLADGSTDSYHVRSIDVLDEKILKQSSNTIQPPLEEPLAHSDDVEPQQTAFDSGSVTERRFRETEDGVVTDYSSGGDASSCHATRTYTDAPHPTSDVEIENDFTRFMAQRRPSSAGIDSATAARGSDEEDASVGDDPQLCEWMEGIEAARRTLGADMNGGFVPPPPTSRRRRPLATGKRDDDPVSSTERNAGEDDHMPSPTEAKFKETFSGESGRLDLGSLQSLLLAAAMKRRRKDPNGVDRFACKACGPAKCKQYIHSLGTASLDGSSVDSSFSGNLLYSALFTGIQTKFSYATEDPFATYGNTPTAGLPTDFIRQARCCSCCGCDSESHETEQEAAAREARSKRAHARRERQAPSESASAARERRISAAKERLQQAEMTGEPIQTSECDILTQAKRGPCTECTCSGFHIVYRAIDAVDPEVMLYCSGCGCRAETHSVDPEWVKAEDARRAAEAAARARWTHQARASSSNASLQRAEVEAYAVLGVQYGADAKAVARAYRQLALKLHPDKQRGGEERETEREAHARFVKVTQAYKLLRGNQGGTPPMG